MLSMAGIRQAHNGRRADPRACRRCARFVLGWQFGLMDGVGAGRFPILVAGFENKSGRFWT
jgi:hypothetical protein